MYKGAVFFLVVLSPMLFGTQCAHEKSIKCNAHTLSKELPCNQACHPSEHKMPKHKGVAIMSALNALQLQPKQRHTIHHAFEVFKKAREETFAQFTQKNFDKDTYIKARVKKQKRMTQAKDALYEVIYQTLDASQIQALNRVLNTNKHKPTLQLSEQ